MALLKRAATVYILTVAAVITVQVIFSPFYRNVVDIFAIWDVLNWLMAVSIIITLIVRLNGKMQLDKEDTERLTRKYIGVYAAFVSAVFLALWFFWNWVDMTIMQSDRGDINLIFWAFINPLFVVVTGLTGYRLWSR